MNSQTRKKLGNEAGAVAVYVALLLPVLVMIAAFGIDVNHVYGVRNELQNAADAGALAGASELNDINGMLQVQVAKDEAQRIASLHSAGGKVVSEFIIQTGHWSNTNREFTPSSNTTQLEGWQEMPGDDLDLNVDFINAVKVETSRSDSPSFFAKIFGIDSLAVTTDAVAWVGFNELTVDFPYAMCGEAIGWPDPECNVGRMSNDGNDDTTVETAMWTNYTQVPSCDTADANDMKTLTDDCANAGSPWDLIKDVGIGTTNGEVVPAFDNMFDCWIANTDEDGDNEPDKVWQLVLPVVDCSSDNTCATLLGAVQVSIVWMNDKEDPHMKDIPTHMEHPDGGSPYECTDTSTDEARLSCWEDFVERFNLENLEEESTPEEMYQTRSVYFMTTCMEAEPQGGSTFNPSSKILAKYPKLVE